MERLTEKTRNFDGTAVSKQNLVDRGMITDYCEKILTKLAEYEDAEEQGLLIRLPFRIGQKVYYIYASCIDGSLMIGSMVYGYSCLDFPRNYYATKAEAEQALAKMKNS